MRRSKRRKRSKHLGVWLPVLGGLVLLVVIAGALLVRDALTVRSSLQDAQAGLVEVRQATGGVELDQAAEALVRADRDLATARSRTGGPLWSMATVVPVVGDSFTTTRQVVSVASAAVAVADRAIAQGGELVGGGLNVSVDDGQVDLAPLAQAAAILDGLPLERLADARDTLASDPPRWAPAEVRDGRAQTLEYADEVIGTVGNGRDLLAALPGFLGANGPRSYFLGVQTSAELRGTGGLIGYYAILTVDDGRFELGSSEVFEGEDELDPDAVATGNIGLLSGDLTQGVAADPEFEARYAGTAATALFSNVNVDPDLPTTAEVALDLFEQRTDRRLDGMVLLDPVAMERLLVAIGGDLDIPDGDAGDAQLPDQLAADQVAQFLLADVYEQLGDGRSGERKATLRALGDVAFANVFDGAWDGVAVGQALGDAATERHLQVYTREEGEQEAFDRLGVTGRLTAPEGADLLAVTANNAVGGKQDVHLGHRVTAEVSLGDPRRDQDDRVTVARDTALRVEVDNPLPSSGRDLYVIGNCLVAPGERGQCFEGPPGENRTWFTTWMPGGAQLVDAGGDDGRFGTQTGQLRGMTVLDRFLETPPESTRGFEQDVAGRAPARIDDGQLVYELSWWAQAKATPTALELSITAPDGWEVVDVVLSGGGSGQGLGAFGDGEAATAEVVDGTARVSGNVTADTRIEVRMVGADDA